MASETLKRFIWDHGPIGLALRLRPPNPCLVPERYAVFLRALAERRELPGAIVEIGCYRGATAAEALRMLKLWDADRPYVCIDTFSGFVPEQFETDEQMGTESSYRDAFDYNSRRAVERTFRHLGYDVEVIEGDITTLADDLLPEQISVGLLDVDLSTPIHAGLEKLVPRMVAGGIVLVDDCEEAERTGWKGARLGYQEFAKQMGLPEKYDAGFGVIEIEAK